jgi:hypothetical protein
MNKKIFSDLHWEKVEAELANLVFEAKKIGIEQPSDKEWDEYRLKNGITNKSNRKVVLSGAIAFLEDKIVQKKSNKKK